MKVSNRIVGTCVFLLVLALAGGVFAQPAQHIQLYEINVKSGAQADFAAYLKKIVEAADKTGAPQGWLTAQGELGTSGTSYYIFVGFDQWSERDAWDLVPEMLVEAFGEAEAQKILKTGGDAIWNFETTVFALDEERSWNLGSLGAAGTPGGAAPFYQLLLGKVKPEMVDEYLRTIAKIKVGQETHGSKRPGIRRTSAIGDSWTFYAAFPFEKWGDLESVTDLWRNVAQSYGEDEARHLQSTLRSCYEERRLFIVRSLPELSRAEPDSTSND